MKDLNTLRNELTKTRLESLCDTAKKISIEQTVNAMSHNNVDTTVLTELSLEQLMVVAKTYGTLTLEEETYGSNKGKYVVEIRFNRKAGSKVWATGINQDIRLAVISAIEEADKIKD